MNSNLKKLVVFALFVGKVAAMDKSDDNTLNSAPKKRKVNEQQHVDLSDKNSIDALTQKISSLSEVITLLNDRINKIEAERKFQRKCEINNLIAHVYYKFKNEQGEKLTTVQEKLAEVIKDFKTDEDFSLFLKKLMTSEYANALFVCRLLTYQKWKNFSLDQKLNSLLQKRNCTIFDNVFMTEDDKYDFFLHEPIEKNKNLLTPAIGADEYGKLLFLEHLYKRISTNMQSTDASGQMRNEILSGNLISTNQLNVYHELPLVRLETRLLRPPLFESDVPEIKATNLQSTVRRDTSSHCLPVNLLHSDQSENEKMWQNLLENPFQESDLS